MQAGMQAGRGGREGGETGEGERRKSINSKSGGKKKRHRAAESHGNGGGFPKGCVACGSGWCT